MSALLVKAIVVSSSPGTVANAEIWFGNNVNVVKATDAKIVIPTSRKP